MVGDTTIHRFNNKLSHTQVCGECNLRVNRRRPRGPIRCTIKFLLYGEELFDERSDDESESGEEGEGEDENDVIDDDDMNIIADIHDIGEQEANAVDNNFNDDGSESTTSECADFIFTVAKRWDIPFKVARVTVAPSVKKLECEFKYYKWLTTVVLPEGLKKIGSFTFAECFLLQSVNIPSTVKKIDSYAFWRCRRLERLDLPDGLRKIEESAFHGYRSIQSIRVPPKVKDIAYKQFLCCDELKCVELSEGLEYIGDKVFGDCPSLKHIAIPSTVQMIYPYAFANSWELEKVQFCDEIEKFVLGESTRDWWSNGVSEKSLVTYSFLARCNVPACLENLTGTNWEAKIHNRLRRIPSVEIEVLHEYLQSVYSELTIYGIANTMSLLELAVWKSKLLEQNSLNMDSLCAETRSLCRDNCGSSIIIPHVLPFLLEEWVSLISRSEE